MNTSELCRGGDPRPPVSFSSSLLHLIFLPLPPLRLTTTILLLSGCLLLLLLHTRHQHLLLGLILLFLLPPLLLTTTTTTSTDGPPATPVPPLCTVCIAERRKGYEREPEPDPAHYRPYAEGRSGHLNIPILTTFAAQPLPFLPLPLAAIAAVSKFPPPVDFLLAPMAKREMVRERGGKKIKVPPSETRGDRMSKRKAKKEVKKRKPSGPRLPSAFRKELDLINPKPRDSDEEIESDQDVYEYEYEEGVAQEETKKNRRFDAVDNLEYELPEDFEDEDLASDDGGLSDQSDDEDDDGGSHARMLQGITGLPNEAFQGKRSKAPVLIDSYEANGNDAQISIQDLLDPLHGKSGYSELRKRLHQIERKPMAVHAPLPKVQREKMERKVAYEHSKKDITKWEPLVKRNREAPTIYFEEDRDLGFSTVGAVTSEFEPRTEFEKKMASLVNDPKVVEAHQKDGLRLLELNKISIEDVKERQDRLAKMRSLLFRHDMKQKRIKKIKSKTYHRMLKKDKMKSVSDEMLVDPEAIQEQALKQEFKRAEERLTLKHKNKSKWAKRIIKRGLKAQDEGTKAAIAEQLRQNEQLTRKMNSMRDSSSENSSDDDDDLSTGTDDEGASKLLMRAKEKIDNIIKDEDEMPKSGVLSLPFMVRALEKKKEAADEEARVALQEYESLRKLEDEDVNEAVNPKLGTSGGRKIFGPTTNQIQKPRKRIERDAIHNSSDSEAESETKESEGEGNRENEFFEARDNKTGTNQRTLSMGFGDSSENSSAKTTQEVAIFASGSWKKMNDEKPSGVDETSLGAMGPALPIQNINGDYRDSDVDSDQEMVDGILSSGAKPEYELPSQDDLIRRAFAGDDVEVEFEKDKMEVLNEENPEPEKLVLLPGWGQWTHIQQKKGLPSWMVKEHEDAKRKREDALKKRKDAHLKHVIISEKTDKKTEKLHTKTLPFPFTSKEVFEQSIRMPIGPDYNPAISVGALNRPAVVKEAGIVIKPIKFEDVNPHDRSDEPKRGQKKPRIKKGKGDNGKMIKRKRAS